MSTSKWNRNNAKPVLKDLFIRAQEFEHGHIERMYNLLKENAKLDGVRTVERSLENEEGSLYGYIIPSEDEGKLQEFRGGANSPIYYDLVLSTDTKEYETLFATMLHELAHLYCGHVGRRNDEWWTSRIRKSERLREIEAECVAYLVCENLKIDNLSREYLSNYVRDMNEPPNDSLGFIAEAANHIEKMCSAPLQPSESTRWLYVDTMLLDGMITFLAPEQGSSDVHVQDGYTSRNLGMKGPIKGYWCVQANNTAEWQSIVRALEMASSSARSKENMVKPTRESWNNIDKITKIYGKGKRRTALNQARRVTANDMNKFEERRRKRLQAPSIHIHTIIQDSRPGLIAWKGIQSASQRLWKVKRRQPSIVKEWHEESTNFLYKIAKTKTEAEMFLDKLEGDGWELYGYMSGEQDVRKTLGTIREG